MKSQKVRSMQKQELTIELVPSTCWFSNVRSEVSRGIWDKIRRKAYRKANYLCEICGGKGEKWPVECHEIWKYIDKTHTQNLIGFIALCPSCHKVKHLVRTTAMGGFEEACDHLKAVNNWDDSKIADYIQTVFKTYDDRSLHNWTIDISYIEEYLNNKMQLNLFIDD